MKVVGIIKDDKITGVQYGIIELPDPEDKKVASIKRALKKIQEIKNQKLRTERTKHK